MPTGNNEISIYFGIETITDVSNLKVIVPHKINHLVRISALMKNKTFKVEDLNYVKERLISEGLGVFSSYAILQLDNGIQVLVMVLSIPETSVQILLNNEKNLEMEILNEVENILNPTIMSRYFAYTKQDIVEHKPIYGGYFIGFRIIQSLSQKKGLSLQQLTIMSADEILEEYMTLID